MAQQTKSPSKAPLLEWIAGTLGLILLLGLLFVIGNDAINGGSRQPPAVLIKTGAITKAADGFVVEFTAVNLSGGTAASLEIEGQLIDGVKVVETSLASIDYLPGHGSVEGGLFYRHNPAGLAVQARPLGYQSP